MKSDIFLIIILFIGIKSSASNQTGEYHENDGFTSESIENFSLVGVKNESSKPVTVTIYQSYGFDEKNCNRTKEFEGHLAIIEIHAENLRIESRQFKATENDLNTVQIY
ncbi:hypothetical protein CWI37_0348p0030 [Hamiltosporidium tvaerminnensis]|uniref:Uncharacterized protein n=1 Tax=Hamiltosporidium tvaerminnensis TaxID=1176355 RepID=A0A4Q9L6A0_9MICR|nr:hypothetical protein CWI37_0348p0030 [Hamiltosporidium tvaerminnensis]